MDVSAFKSDFRRNPKGTSFGVVAKLRSILSRGGELYTVSRTV